MHSAVVLLGMLPLRALAMTVATGQMSIKEIEADHAAAREQAVAALRAPSPQTGIDSLLKSTSADLGRISRTFSDVSLLQVSSPKASTSVHKTTNAKKMSNEEILSQMNHLSGPAAKQMPQMLQLLKSMYSNFKGRIGKANRIEADNKKKYEVDLKDLDAKKMQWKKAVPSETVSDTYQMLEKHLVKQRQLSHRMYRTGLQVSHAGMEKFKDVISMMEKAMGGKKLSLSDMKELQKVEPAPVLLQVKEVKELATWAKRAQGSIRAANGYHAQQ